jgi:hypothetical protein
MKTLSVLFFLFTSISIVLASEGEESWRSFAWLIGSWQGEGSGQPGQGGGFFSFKQELDSNILVRTSRTEYPAVRTNPRLCMMTS